MWRSAFKDLLSTVLESIYGFVLFCFFTSEMFKMTSYYYLAKLSNSHILSNRILLEWALCQGFSNKSRP